MAVMPTMVTANRRDHDVAAMATVDMAMRSVTGSNHHGLRFCARCRDGQDQAERGDGSGGKD